MENGLLFYGNKIDWVSSIFQSNKRVNRINNYCFYTKKVEKNSRIEKNQSNNESGTAEISLIIIYIIWNWCGK